MSDQSSQSASRAEARRRARRRAKGEPVVETEELDAPTAGAAAPAEGGFLSRIFPAAPPLPGKPDPLAGFTYSGPFSGLLGGLYLLAGYPRAFVIPAIIWTYSEIFARTLADPILATVGVVLSFGAFVLAGWWGWQRPWAFGLAAAVLGVGLFTGIIGTLLLPYLQDEAIKQGSTPPTAISLYLGSFTSEGFQFLFGAVAGWYGGYLRRRMASQPSQRRRGR